MNHVDLNTVKEYLGHTTITTTEIYAHISQDFMKEGIEKLSKFLSLWQLCDKREFPKLSKNTKNWDFVLE